jgi:Sulfotransferase family
MLAKRLQLVEDRKVRDSTPGFEERCVDVHFGDLMTDPNGELERICDLAGIAYSDESRTQVQVFLDDNPRTTHGENEYSAEKWGLNSDGLRRRFGFYIDRFNVPIEHKRG